MDTLITAALVAALTCLCVLLHFEVLNLMMRGIATHAANRRVILIHVLGLLAVHIAEIWIFGLGIFVLTEWLAIGSVVGGVSSLFDYVYFSAMIYTTVGFGDLIPQGPLRLLAGTEAVAGLSLITWSASYTFLLMQRIWKT